MLEFLGAIAGTLIAVVLVGGAIAGVVATFVIPAIWIGQYAIITGLVFWLLVFLWFNREEIYDDFWG